MSIGIFMKMADLLKRLEYSELYVVFLFAYVISDCLKWLNDILFFRDNHSFICQKLLHFK